MKFKRGIWFVSDIHYGHWNVNQFCNRGYKSLEEMNEDLIKVWNEYIQPNDIVYILGDFFWSTANYSDIKLFNGNKFLIRGNHCKGENIKYLKNGISLVCEEMIIKIANKMVRLSHYPYKYGFWKSLYSNLKLYFNRSVWPSKKRFLKNPRDDGKFLLHGHHHNPENHINDKQFNVCWDIHKRPINIQEIETFIQKYLT